MATYAIGDLHGEITLLRHLLNILTVHLDDQLIFLGDYMNKGEDSVSTVLFLADLAHTQSCIFLRGNHDEAWLDCWNGEAFTRYPRIPGARSVWEQHPGQISPRIGAFLAKTLPCFADGYAYYAHAGAQPGVPFWQSPLEVYIWGRNDFLRNPLSRWGLPVVFGHYELTEPLITDTLIGIDTAAYRTGILTAIRIEDRHIFQTSTRRRK